MPAGAGRTASRRPAPARGRRLPGARGRNDGPLRLARVLSGVATAGPHRTTGSDRIDRVLTHRLWGTLISRW